MSVIDRAADVPAGFDAAWYAARFPDVGLSGLAPAEHYRLIGARIGRPAGPQAALARRPAAGRAEVPFRSFGIIRHCPLISVVIVSFNSGKDLAALLPTLAAQSWAPLEVIVVENGMEETEALCRAHIPDCRWLRADNPGFAEANNIAVELARGEFIALVNPDTVLAPDCLQQLVEALRMDASAAVAVPKIDFFTPFLRLSVEADAPFSLARADLLAGLDYAKLFVRNGRQEGAQIHSDGDGRLEVDLPHARRALRLELAGGRGLRQARVGLGHAPVASFVAAPAGRVVACLPYEARHAASARPLVNNAGSGLRADGTPYDRGFGEEDDGRFFSKAYVEALCGCMALVRRVAVMERKLFAPAFFAYFEDSELSAWLRGRGYRILYQPAARVAHRHSESTEEHSPVWRTLVARSGDLYRRLTGGAPLADFAPHYEAGLPPALRQRLEAYDDDVRAAGGGAALVAPGRLKICIYNSYFASMGGGEKHAIDIACALAGLGEVYLASESDFDMAGLEAYFGVDLAHVRKLVSTEVDTHFTAKFDVFINATFRSNLVPAAGRNIYVVSFPHRDVDPAILPAYTFLHNSPYTRDWAGRLWGAHDGRVLLPILGFAGGGARADAKRRQILTLGRFTYDGHCKNHHQILRAFLDVRRRHRDLADWELVVIGSFEASQPSAARYLADLQALAAGAPVQIIANATRAQVAQACAASAIYCHATGLGMPDAAPEKQEHFGIAPYEAMLAGCAPVVHARGGPAAQVAGLADGWTFADEAGLARALAGAMRRHAAGGVDAGAIAAHARALQAGNGAVLAALIDEMRAGAPAPTGGRG